MVWITEWLCSQAHSLMLIAWHDRETDAQSVLKRGEELFAHGPLPRTCRMCGAEVRAETQPTIHVSIHDALQEFVQRERREEHDA